LKKGGIVEKRGEEETKSMPQVPVAETGVPVENNKVREYLKKISLELLYCELVRGGVRT
jgi:hypothetical protein